MDNGVSLASVGGKIFEGLLGFLPDWIQIAVVALVLLAVVATWVVKIRRKLAYRRAVRQGHPIHAAARRGQAPGASYLGDYAPGAAQQNGAPQPGAQPGPAVPSQQPGGQPSGADFLGSYAPQSNSGRRED